MDEEKRRQTAARQQRFRERQAEARRMEQETKGLPALPTISTLPGTARWKASLAAARALVKQVNMEMADYYEDRSAEWQNGERGEEFAEKQQAVEALLEEIDAIEL